MLQNRSILITGCSTGIGHYCAHALKKEGYQVFATVRKKEDIKKLKSEGLENTFWLDLSDSKSIKDAVDAVLEISNGKLYALFNNGAYGQPGAVEDLTKNVLKEQFEVNVFGTQELTNLIIPIMRKQGYGKIVQNSSVLGFVSLPFRGAYNASKYALEALSDTMRLELKGSGIYVSLIEPGPIRSNFRKNALEKFLQNIDRENSYHRQKYIQKLQSLKSQKEVPFTLGEDAVYRALLHALNSSNPKARYKVTFPTYLFWFLKRILSTKMLDRVLYRLD